MYFVISVCVYVLVSSLCLYFVVSLCSSLGISLFVVCVYLFSSLFMYFVFVLFVMYVCMQFCSSLVLYVCMSSLFSVFIS